MGGGPVWRPIAVPTAKGDWAQAPHGAYRGRYSPPAVPRDFQVDKEWCAGTGWFSCHIGPAKIETRRQRVKPTEIGVSALGDAFCTRKETHLNTENWLRAAFMCCVGIGGGQWWGCRARTVHDYIRRWWMVHDSIEMVDGSIMTCSRSGCSVHAAVPWPATTFIIVAIVRPRCRSPREEKVVGPLADDRRAHTGAPTAKKPSPDAERAPTHAAPTRVAKDMRR